MFYHFIIEKNKLHVVSIVFNVGFECFPLELIKTKNCVKIRSAFEIDELNDEPSINFNFLFERTGMYRIWIKNFNSNMLYFPTIIILSTIHFSLKWKTNDFFLGESLGSMDLAIFFFFEIVKFLWNYDRHGYFLKKIYIHIRLDHRWMSGNYFFFFLNN